MYNIFSSYIHEELFNFNTKQFKKEILDLKTKDKGRMISNYGGWQSNDFRTVPKEFISLFNKISANVEKVEKHLSLSKKLTLYNLWYNVNGLSSFNKPHTHPGSIISGVYYISIPQNSGNIVFLNQDMDKFYDLIDSYNNYNSSTWTIISKENLCIFFPSYLRHYVEPNFNKKERISISFNYGY